MAACLIMFALGFIYGWSVFSAPIAAEFQWQPAVLSFTFTLLMWVFCAGGFVGARLCDRTSPRATLMVSAACIFAAFCSTAMLASADAPWVLYITYGVFGGLGVGMAYTVTLGTALAWFPDRAGAASGILLLCYGASTMLLSSVVAWLCGIMNWRMAFPLMGVVMATVIAALSLAMRRPSREEGALLPRPSNAKEKFGASERNYTTVQMLRTPVFWSYAAWMLLMCIVSLGFTGNVNQFALEAGASPVVAVALVGAFSVANGFGRLGFGFIFDAAGVFRTILMVAAAHAVSAALIIVSLVLELAPLMSASLVFAGFTIGGTSVCGSGFAMTAFGGVHYAQNLSVLNLTIIPAALIGPLCMSLSVGSLGSYVPGLEASVVLACIGMFCALAVRTFIKRLH